MKKVRVIGGVIAAVPATAAALVAPAAAQAAPTAQAAPAAGKTVALAEGRLIPATAPRWGYIVNGPASFYKRTGGEILVPDGSSVYVTCYYTGAGFPHDNYWDHVTQIRSPFGGYRNVTGHVADYYVSLNHKYPTSAGIPHC
jgi:hypothetical protein